MAIESQALAPSLDPRALRRMRRASLLAGALTTAIGACALASRPLGLAWLRTLGGPTETPPGLALGIVLTGAALLLRRAGPRARAAAGVAAAAAATIGAATLASHVLGLDLGAERLLLSRAGRLAPTSAGGLGPAASVTLLVGGVAIVLLRRSGGIAQALALGIAGVPLLGLVGYAYGAGPAHGVPRLAAIAVPASIALLAADAGVLLAEPDRGFVARLASAGAGSALARRALLYGLALPLALGGLAVAWGGASERVGLSVSLLVVAMAMGLAVLVVREAGAIDALEATKRRAQAEGEAARVALARALEGEREARAGAEAASHAKDLFLATLSHELRTPLSAILGWSEILRDGAADRERLARGLGAIDRNGRALARLVSDLLDMARLARGQLEVTRADVDLAEIVARAVDALRPRAEARGVALRLEAASVRVDGDAGRLEQVTSTLVSNAVDFTPAGGSVDVRLRAEAGRALLEVADTGIGIHPGYLPHVFDAFSQADAGARRRHGGLGVGLALARELVARHGGTIGAQSGGPGSGATFTVALPARGAERTGAAGLGGARVLVVDDEADSRELLVQLLASWGARPTAAASAREALEAVARDRPDLLVSDIGMPGEDGYALLDGLRRWEREHGNGSIPAAALTAFARSEDRSRVLSAGFDAHLAKPIEPEALLTTLEGLLRRRGESPPLQSAG